MNTIFTGLFGSHLYHLDTPESDKDYKSIYIPEHRDLILGRAKRNITTSTGGNNSKNSNEDIDNETFSLQEFIKLACQFQTVAIDMLHTPKEVDPSGNFYMQRPNEIWDFLVDNRKLFYTKNTKPFMGYVKQQAAKYAVKGSKLAVMDEVLELCDSYKTSEQKPISYIRRYLPQTEYTYWETKDCVKDAKQVGTNNFYVINGSMMQDNITIKEFRERVQKMYDKYGARVKLAKDNNGIDWKAISHALRAGYQLQDIFLDGDFEYPLKQTQFLLDVKLGNMDWLTEVQPELESLIDNLEFLAKESTLPDEVNLDFWDDFVYTVYTGTFKY